MDNDRSEFSIGVVSKLTGINPGTLRMWEKRYEGFSAKRSPGKSRLYDDSDIKRLRLVKKLLDNGYQPGKIMHLDISGLEDKLKYLQDNSELVVTSSNSYNLILCGRPLLNPLGKTLSDKFKFKIVGSYQYIEDIALADLADIPNCLLFDVNTLTKDNIDQIKLSIKKLKITGVVCLYEIATKFDVELAESEGFACIQRPCSEYEVVRAFKDVIGFSNGVPLNKINNLKYSEEQLSFISAIKSSVDCECPNHLSKIISGLVAFEKYSLDCKNTSVDDAFIHQQLYNSTAAARTIMEKALTKVLEYENISVDDVQ